MNYTFHQIVFCHIDQRLWLPAIKKVKISYFIVWPVNIYFWHQLLCILLFRVGILPNWFGVWVRISPDRVSTIRQNIKIIWQNVNNWKNMLCKIIITKKLADEGQAWFLVLTVDTRDWATIGCLSPHKVEFLKLHSIAYLDTKMYVFGLKKIFDYSRPVGYH